MQKGNCNDDLSMMNVLTINDIKLMKGVKILY